MTTYNRAFGDHVQQHTTYSKIDETTVRSAYTTPSLLSECALAQLALAFLLSAARADPYVVAPLVCLYALREADRRAMLLYVALSIAACPLDLAFLFRHSGGFLVKVGSLVGLVLKAGVSALPPGSIAHSGFFLFEVFE